MAQKNGESDAKDDTGYYTPKNILNPAMFRLAEITRALSEVNMDIDQEKGSFEDRRHTINVEQHNSERDDDERLTSLDHIETLEFELPMTRTQKWGECVRRHEDGIGRALIISLIVSIILLIAMIIFWG